MCMCASWLVVYGWKHVCMSYCNPVCAWHKLYVHTYIIIHTATGKPRGLQEFFDGTEGKMAFN